MNNNFKFTFQKAVEDYLLSVCSDYETVTRTDDISYENTKCILYLREGIRKLNIRANTYIGVEYYDNPSLFSYAEIESKYTNDFSVVVFVNVEKNNDLHSNDINGNLRLIFLNDIDLSKKYIKPNERIVDSAYKKSKCVNVDNLVEFFRFIFRVKFLQEFFPGKMITPYIFGGNRKSKSLGGVFPFRYVYNGIDYVFFENKNNLFTSFPEYFEGNFENTLFEHVSVQKNEVFRDEFCRLTVYEKSSVSFKDRNNNRDYSKRRTVVVSKVLTRDLTADYITLFDNGGRYEIDDFFPIYKYRQFEKTRYDASEEKCIYSSKPTKYPESYEICIGSRSALEKDQIWFSTHDSLNDPFDLVIRKPSFFAKKVTMDDVEYHAINYDVMANTGVAVFCSTTENDNILMWAHYGDSDKGMCSMYLQNELLDAISNDKSISLCLYGRVLYSSKRPRFNISLSMLQYFAIDVLILYFNLLNLFSKFIDWKYEKERRFIVFPSNYESGSFKGLSVTLKTKDNVFGYKFSKTKFASYLTNIRIPFKTFSLSDDEYKLI